MFAGPAHHICRPRSAYFQAVCRISASRLYSMFASPVQHIERPCVAHSQEFAHSVQLICKHYSINIFASPVQHVCSTCAAYSQAPCAVCWQAQCNIFAHFPQLKLPPNSHLKPGLRWEFGCNFSCARFANMLHRACQKTAQRACE